jgi:hypothetical protein
MYFVNLDKLKIEKHYNFKTKEFDLILSPEDTIFDMKEKARNVLDNVFEETSIETFFKIDIQCGPINDPEDAESFFTTAVNVFSAVFFDCMCIPKGRNRERRLDVPDNLKVISTNMSLLKRAINMQTYYNAFHLQIDWVNPVTNGIVSDIYYTYDLIPQGDKENDN